MPGYRICPECCFPYTGDACDNPACDASRVKKRTPAEQREFERRNRACKVGAICAYILPDGYVLARVEDTRIKADGMPSIARVLTLDSLREYHDRPAGEDPSSVEIIQDLELQRAARRVVKAKAAPQEPITKEELQQLIMDHKES